MKILGIGGSSHDFSYCIVENGKILYAVEEERISREKHAMGARSWRMRGLEYSLLKCGLTIKDIDLIVTNNICNMVSIIDRNYVNEVVSINHHMAHIAASYYSSPFRECAIAVFDGCGDTYKKSNHTLGEIYSSGYANDGRIALRHSVFGKVEPFDHTVNIPCFVRSLGHFYMYITNACGFRPTQEGKTMGLAPYGNGRFIHRIDKHICYNEHEFMNTEIVQEIKSILSQYGSSFQVRADLAYAAQYLLEKYMFMLLNDLYQRYPSANLCMAGGVALNSAVNGKLIKHTPFKKIYIYPAAGDSGTSVGAALYGYYHICGNKFEPSGPLATVYSGTTYTNQEIEKDISKYHNQVQYKRLESEQLYSFAAKEIARGKVCGWFQGRAEMGPRALGNRSILATPTNPEMKNFINDKIKYREDFRPFAPSVLEEAVMEFFDTDFPQNPYMLYIGSVKKEKRHLIPAVTHTDGSARLQTVSSKMNPQYYKLIKEFGKITGIPILLNTSFNIRGQPIVETPAQAIQAFLDCSMELLVINNYIVVKK